MILLAIDPGSQKSGFVVYDTIKDDVIEFGKEDNNKFISRYPELAKQQKMLVLIERPDFASNGIGREVLDMAIWCGRFIQAFPNNVTYGRKFLKTELGFKNDSQIVKAIKLRYFHVKLKADSWQAFIMIHAYMQNIIPL